VDIRFEDERKKGRSPTTRLYLPKDGEEAPAQERDPARTRRPRAGHEPGVRVKKPEMTSLGRIGLIISGFLFAGMVLFTLAGYERISRAYADINALNSEIDLTKLRINELNVQIECAVTIQDAQKVAEAYGMQYPEKNQYIRIGDPLPFSNSEPTESPVPETTPEPNTDTTGGGEQPPAGG
jgi:hypothetical protein